MRKVAFHLQKGGVGKTTLSVSTAVSLADAGRKTVLLDLDPQGNSTSWLLGDRDVTHEAADVLFGRVDVSAWKSARICPCFQRSLSTGS